MCRHLGYLGPARSVGDVLTRGTHSLRVQSWAPTEMRGGGTINADGFGAAWWTDEASSGSGARGMTQSSGSGARGMTRASGSEARGMTQSSGSGARGTTQVASYRNPMPIWSDPAVDEVLSGVESTAVLAAVRSATVGMPVERSACAPFTDDTWAFSHNGVVFGWPEALVDIVAEVPTVDLLTLPAATDSAALWITLRHLLSEHEPEKALRALVSRVESASPGPRLNLLLGDGTTLYATSLYHSLYVLRTEDSVTLASEPLDENADWQPVADRQFVVATAGHVEITDLE